MREMPDSLIFDLDGTLWNATVSICKVWNSVIKEYPELKKEITVSDLEGVMGKALDEIGEIFFPDTPFNVRSEIMEKCCERQCPLLEKEGGKLYEGVNETLNNLCKKYGLFIVSNCEKGYIPAFMKANNFEKYFKDYEHPGRTGLSKGENIKIIIERNNLKAPVYVGDTQGDFESAKFAGIPFVFASYGFGEVFGADYTIRKFSDLNNLF